MKNAIKWTVTVLAGAALVYTVISCFGYMEVIGSMENPLANFLPMIVVVLVASAMCVLCLGFWSRKSTTLRKTAIVFAILIVVALVLLLLAKVVYVQFF